MGQPVRVVAPNGKAGTLDSDELQSALQEGYRVETEEDVAQREQAAHFDNPLKAGGIAALRGASFGLSDALAVGADITTPEDLKGYKDANPVASTVGEAGGIVASSLVGPGVGLAKGATAVERMIAGEGAGLGTKLLGKAAAGALEGGAYGAGQAVSDSVLENQDLTAESLLAHVGLGAALGAGGNALVGAGGAAGKKLVSAAAEGLEDTSVKEAIGKFSRERMLKAAGFIQSDLGKVELGRQQQIADDILALGRAGKFKAGDKVESVVAAVNDAKKEAGALNGDILRSVDELVGGAGPQVREAAKQAKATIRSQLEEEMQQAANRTRLGLKPQGANGERLADILAMTNEKKGAALSSAVKKQQKALDSLAEEVFAATKPQAQVGFDMQSAISDLRKKLLPQFSDPAFEPQQKQLERLIAGYEKKAGEGVSFREAAAMKSNLQRTISKFADTPIAQQAKVDVQRILDDAIETQMGKVAGPDVLTKYQEAKRLYGSFAEAAKAGKKGINRQLGNRSVSLTDHLVGIGGTVASVATGNIAPVLLGGASAIANKIMRERGSSALALVADKLSRASLLDDAIGSVTKMMDEGTSAAIGKALAAGKSAATPVSVGTLLGSSLAPVGAVTQRPKDAGDAIALHADDLAELASNPAMLTDRLSRAIGAVDALHPNLGTAFGIKATNAVRYLSGAAPKPPAGSMLSAFDGATKWQPSDAERSRFERKLRVVTDPLSVYEDIKQGSVTRDAVEALQAVYPEMYGDIQRRLLERLGGVKEQLPYERRLALAALFNVPVEQSLRPEFIAALQANFSAPQAQQNSPQQSKPGPQIGHKDQSAAQRLEARG